MSKPREFWIGTRVYKYIAHEHTFLEAKESDPKDYGTGKGESWIHVIEKSAYDEAKESQERDFNNLTLWREKAKEIREQADKLAEALDEILQYNSRIAYKTSHYVKAEQALKDYRGEK